MSSLYRTATAWMVVSLFMGSAVHGQFEMSARLVPDTANAIVMVRAEKIMNSPIAKKERWKTERIKAFKSGAAFLPPTTKSFLLASQIDYEFMEPIWQVSVFEDSNKAIDIVKVSERLRGSIEEIGGKRALVLPNDAYVVQMDSGTIASMSPANRQVTTRWLKSRSSSVLSVSPYLKSAIEFADQNSDIIVAFDLEGVVGAERIRDKVESSGLVGADDLEAVCDCLSDVEGVTLGITINDKINGAIKVDFTSLPRGMDSYGKKLLLEAIGNNGYMIDDFKDWEPSVKGNQFVLRGQLSNMGLRQIGSLIEHPLTIEFESGGYSTAGGSDMKTRSLQYFQAVNQLVDELRSKEAKALRTYAKWFDKYARKIDGISVLNVDPAVQGHGRFVSDKFLEISGILYGANLEKIQGQQQFSDYGGAYSSGYDYGVGRSRTTYYFNNQRNRTQAAGQAKEKGANLAREVMREVTAETAQVRSDMTNKYGINF